MDCEMVGMGDDGATSALAHVCIVNAFGAFCGAVPPNRPLCSPPQSLARLPRAAASPCQIQLALSPPPVAPRDLRRSRCHCVS